jgi:hypothetical protein
MVEMLRTPEKHWDNVSGGIAFFNPADDAKRAHSK